MVPFTVPWMVMSSWQVTSPVMVRDGPRVVIVFCSPVKKVLPVSSASRRSGDRVPGRVIFLLT
jgi:hypothetical protein